jgi:hypothetical protein
MCEPGAASAEERTRGRRNALKMQQLEYSQKCTADECARKRAKTRFLDLHNFTAIAVCDE